MLLLFCALARFCSTLICILTLYKHRCIVRIWKPTKKQVDKNILMICTVMTAASLFLSFDSNWAWTILKRIVFSVRFSKINRMITYWLLVILGLYLLKMKQPKIRYSNKKTALTQRHQMLSVGFIFYYCNIILIAS